MVDANRVRVTLPSDILSYRLSEGAPRTAEMSHVRSAGRSGTLGHFSRVIHGCKVRPSLGHDALRLLARHGAGPVATGAEGVRFYASMSFPRARGDVPPSSVIHHSCR